MLFGEDFGGRHDHGLTATLHRAQRSQCGHDGLSAPDIALQETVHRVGLAQFGLDFMPYALLRRGQRKR